MLSAVLVVILCLGFAAPVIVEEYAKQALVFEPTNLSIDSLTSSGARARVQGYFSLDASRVKRKPVRDLGRFGTAIARYAESEQSDVKVYLPEYGNVLLGTAAVPRIKVDLRNGHYTGIDFLTDLQPGDISGIRTVAKDWLDGRIGQLRVQGRAEVGITSGLFAFGKQSISKEMLFKGDDIPDLPALNITKLNFNEVELPRNQRAMAANVSATLPNKYPFKFWIPSLGFDILIPGCFEDSPYLHIANATTGQIQVDPKTDVRVDVVGIVQELPTALTAVCPDSKSSPLDVLLGQYIHGTETTLYVRGSEKGSEDTPKWITDLISSVTVPMPFPGHTLDKLIKSFSLTDVLFSLPDQLAEPDTPGAQPKVSATVKALVGLPKEMNFPLDVKRVRADADVYFKGQKMGHLDLHKWQPANSSRLDSGVDGQTSLAVESLVEKAPLQITDQEIFTQVLQSLLFGRDGVSLGIKATVDVETDTALGVFTVRELPAEGKLFVKPIAHGGVGGFKPEVGGLRILETGKSSLLLEAMVNMTNPTIYSADVPFVNISISVNDTVVGHATAEELSVVPGRNENIRIEARWHPLEAGGQPGLDVARELLSQYISGSYVQIWLNWDLKVLT